MALYIHFENGQQIEVADYDKKPDENWVKAPASFKWDKMYTLDSKGKVKALTKTALDNQALNDNKSLKKVEIKMLTDRIRSALYPVGQSKGEEYRLKADAAKRILELISNKIKLDKKSIDYQLLKYEADVRGSSVEELAEKINTRSKQTILSMGMVAAFEKNAKQFINNAKDIQELDKELEILVSEIEKKLKLNENPNYHRFIQFNENVG